MSQKNCLKEGDHFILEVNNESQQFYVAQKGQFVKLGKRQQFPVECMIGCQWGSIFEVDQDNQKLVQVEEPSCYIDPWLVNATEKSNMDIFQNDKNQQITQEEILKMKEDKVGGVQIVDALIAGSKTFVAKNEFSQQKYKNKKAKKYASWGVLRKPTAWSISEVYYRKNPARVYNLRSDTLSMLLSAANVRAGGRLLVIDACVGLVTGASLERMGGQGLVCQVQFNDRGQRALIPGDAVSKFNLSKQEMSVLRVITYNLLIKGRDEMLVDEEYVGYTDEGMTYNEPVQDLQLDSEDTPSSKLQHKFNSLDNNGLNSTQKTTASHEINNFSNLLQKNGTSEIQIDDKKIQNDDDELDNHEDLQQNQLQQKQNQIKEWTKPWPEVTPEEIQDMVSIGFDGVIIAAPSVNTFHLVELLTPFIMGSASIAIFSNYLEPLTECYGKMQDSKNYINLLIQEAWMREYQVLPARTRPPMTMEGTGGYFLMATKVIQEDTNDIQENVDVSKDTKKQKIRK
eukprot:TRINITY_DN415_c0_g1_i1.p1 TRINITY_DN415_c0_g1~~TRINITY_DN415_c0_g1_i1.p1  ORF type:complete len:552 (+),score=70.10 TRINITY_DN415_c0_g1_i1:123-1658(+)